MDINPAALAALGVRDDVIGRQAAEALGPLSELVAPPGSVMRDSVAEMPLSGAGSRYCEVSFSGLRSRQGAVAGHLIVLHDITARRAAEQEKVRLIGELTTALADVKTLSGLLPICASCRKIRDDSGYWQSLEKYVEGHSQAQFSHGLCEDCMRRLYPDLMEEGPG